VAILEAQTVTAGKCAVNEGTRQANDGCCADLLAKHRLKKKKPGQSVRG
jgi:hypothetical protein